MQTKASAGYDVDLVLWAETQAAALREGRFADVDIENVSEEIESLGRSDKRELRSRLATLMLHLFKLEYQSNLATNSWRLTIVEQAAQVAELLEESPSLRPRLWQDVITAYKSARRQAAIETGLSLATFPTAASQELQGRVEAALKEASDF